MGVGKNRAGRCAVVLRRPLTGALRRSQSRGRSPSPDRGLDRHDEVQQAHRRQGDRDVYEVPPENDPQGILYLAAGPGGEGLRRGGWTLRVIHHPRIVVGPVDVAAFTEYRLVEAVQAGP